MDFIFGKRYDFVANGIAKTDHITKIKDKLIEKQKIKMLLKSDYKYVII